MSTLSELPVNTAYGRTEETWQDFKASVMGLIEGRSLTMVCEAGAGANPLLSVDFVEENDVEYTVLDISRDELAKGPPEFDRIVADIASPRLATGKKFELVFSKMLAEHTPNARQFHSNVLDMLVEGGLAVHLFPTLYALPFLVNRLLPEAMTQRILKVLAPRDEYRKQKFPAHYHWCRGPTRRQLTRLTSLGYEIVEYKGLFGHGAYYRGLDPLARLHDRWADYLTRHPIPQLTSYAQLVLRKA